MCESYFYKLQSLDDEHLLILKILFQNADENLKKMLYVFIQFISAIDSAKSEAETNKSSQKFAHLFLLINSNTLENLHGRFENDVKPILKSLLNRDLEVLDQEKNMVIFCNFLAQQMTRTKAIKDIVLSNLKNTSPDLASKFEGCWWIISYFMGTNLGASIWLSRNNDKHCLLINETEEAFITSDLPVINTHPNTLKNNLVPPSEDEVDIYYPISPHIAYMINKSDRFSPGLVFVSLKDVESLNRQMAKNASEYIIGNSADIIKKYIKDVGDWINFIKSKKS